MNADKKMAAGWSQAAEGFSQEGETSAAIIAEGAPLMQARPYRVEIIAPSGKATLWDTFDLRAAADSVAARLRAHGMYAVVRRGP